MFFLEEWGSVKLFLEGLNIIFMAEVVILNASHFNLIINLLISCHFYLSADWHSLSHSSQVLWYLKSC